MVALGVARTVVEVVEVVDATVVDVLDVDEDVVVGLEVIVNEIEVAVAAP